MHIRPEDCVKVELGSMEESNHRTICMVWQDGMWQVDDIAFLSDDDFAAHKYADLNK